MLSPATVEAARNGSGEALGELLRPCRQYLFAIAANKVGGRLEHRVSPSSLVQETCLRAVKKFDQFRGSSEQQLLAWLRQIMLNYLVSLLRQPQFRNVMQPLPPDLPGKADATAERAVQTEEVVAALDRLPPHYRRMIQLRHYEKMSFEEIGRLSNCSADAARKVWVRAEFNLGQELQAFQ